MNLFNNPTFLLLCLTHYKNRCNLSRNPIMANVAWMSRHGFVHMLGDNKEPRQIPLNVNQNSENQSKEN